MQTVAQLNTCIVACKKCPRLVTYTRKVAQLRKKEFQDWCYWGKPVPGFGDERARLWIIGLAPAAHGANRTGRMFTGDSSGRWLYQALYSVGLANQPTSESPQDNLTLKDTYISAVIRCAPPDNKPLPCEIANCREYLEGEFEALTNLKIVLALGKIAFDAAKKLLAKKESVEPSKSWMFRHGAVYSIGSKQMITSYHPSRQNTQTGKLTASMWNDVFKKALGLLAG